LILGAPKQKKSEQELQNPLFKQKKQNRTKKSETATLKTKRPV